MLIKFEPKVEHLKCVCLTPVKGKASTKTMIKLLPGINEVTDEDWACMKNNIKREISKGEIVTLAQKVKVKGVETEVTNLKGLPANVAVRYVSECTNPETLTKWYGEVINEEVRLAITKRFKKLGLELPEDEIPVGDDDTDENDNDADENESEQADEFVDYASMKVSQLKELCEKKGIDVSNFKQKQDYIDALESEE